MTARGKGKKSALEQPAKPVKAGREAIPEILEAMTNGASVRSECEKRGIAIGSFFRWVGEDEELSEQYTRAREARADLAFEEMDDLSDQAMRAESQVQVAALRLVADNLKWKLARMAPKKYGDRTALDHGGSVNVTLFDGEQARRMAQQLIRDDEGDGR
jgi:hypothetical protein